MTPRADAGGREAPIPRRPYTRDVDPLQFIRDDWDSLEPYHPVKPLDVLADEIGVPVSQLVKLDANENLYGAHDAVREAIGRADLHIYPDPGQGRLRAAIAEYVGVTAEQVVAGQGADDLIDIILRLVRPAAIIDSVPTFAMYGFLAKINGARVIAIPRSSGFEVDVAATVVAIEANPGAIVFLTSPNNPTGNRVRDEELSELLATGALVVVDEAYIEFSGGTHTRLLDANPNLILLRTFSKWAALAGLRVGYALCHAALAERMMAIKQPYNVNIAAEAAAIAALEHRGEILETVRMLAAERERMTTLLAGFGWLRAHPSEANFVLFDVEGRNAGAVADGLRRQGVLVRYYNRPLLENCIRISAGRPEDTDRLVEALKTLEVS
ncbi:MAG: histidinol-phosphate transaminase [Dehalococcoidia bacterium]|nr:histidinol-phosphate transaminase [Dehalococcoidia bacterium]